MQRSPLVLGLAAVFAGMTALLFVLAAVFGDFVVLFVAIPFAAATYVFWYHATGQFGERVRRGGGVDGRAGGRIGGAGEQGPFADFGAGPREDRGARTRFDREARGARQARETRRGTEQRARQRARQGARARTGRGPSGGRGAGRGRGAGTGSGPGAGTRAGGGRIDPDTGPTRREAYATLGLTPGADADEVRRAYREKVKEVHPDRGGDEERFRAVIAAYERLTD